MKDSELEPIVLENLSGKEKIVIFMLKWETELQDKAAKESGKIECVVS